MRYSKGVCWIADCRIPFVDEGDIHQGKTHFAGGNGMGVYGWNKEIKESGKEYKTTQGRFTPNLLVCDDMLNDGVIRKSDYNPNAAIKQYGGGTFGGGKTNSNNGYGDAGSSSRFYDLDLWFDKMLEKL